MYPNPTDESVGYYHSSASPTFFQQDSYTVRKIFAAQQRSDWRIDVDNLIGRLLRRRHYTAHRPTTGSSIHDASFRFLDTVIVGTPVAGILANVSLSAPAMAIRRR